MNDRPNAEELLGAVEHFLREEALPALEGPLRFHARVAANVVGIVARELACEEADLRAEWEGLAALLDEEPLIPEGLMALRSAVAAGNEELTRRIREGEADEEPWRAQVLSHLKRVVDDKLAVSLPGSPGKAR